MRRQRNMAQNERTEQNARKRINEMEISNLSYAEFKILVIRMLKEFTGYFNSIKKTWVETKITLSEVKKNL